VPWQARVAINSILMRKTLVFIVLYFQFSILFGQPSIPTEQIDSLFEEIHVSDNDWAISLSIEQAGTIPMLDSLGKIIYEDPRGTFVFFKIGTDHFLQKFWYKYLHDPYRAKVIIGNRLKLGKAVDFDYPVDSILLAYKEGIYPYVYKDEVDDTYNVQQPADHEPYYGMYFKTVKKDGSIRFFEETSLKESVSFMPNRNLNYLYNSRTFIYRSFLKLLSMIKQNTKVLGGQ